LHIIKGDYYCKYYEIVVYYCSTGGKSLKINNIEVNYIKEGNSDNNILLLHGWGSNIDLFRGIINNLSKTHTVYALDMPGFGKTSEPKISWNVDDYVEFVIKFIEKMKIDKLSLLGHSFGGRVIIKLVNRENLNFEIEKLILVDSAGILPRNKKKTIKTRVYKTLKVIVGNNIVKKVFPDALENLKKKFGSEDYRNASGVMRETLVKVVNEDLESLLPNIKQSTLLIWGTEDTATPLSDAKIMENLIPDSGIVEVKGAGHYSFLEQPQLIDAVLTSFLK
jgi:pimeloyl-ACP methyl ester carboxylesterase